MNTRFFMELRDKHYTDDLCRDADLADLAVCMGWSFDHALGWYLLVNDF